MVQKRPTSLDYLSKSGTQKETVREYVEGSRKILLAQIAINNKTEETELLKEYIVMEKDKLEEGRKTFQEDQEKYEKFKLDLQARSHKTEEEAQRKQREIEAMSYEIYDLKKQEGEL